MPRAKKPWFTTIARPLLGGPWNLASSTPKGFGKGLKLEHRCVCKPRVFTTRALKMPERIVHDVARVAFFLRLLLVKAPRAIMEIDGHTS